MMASNVKDGYYLKFEDVQRQFRPVERQFDSIPCMINIHDPARIVKPPKKRKVKKGDGYCEICDVPCLDVDKHCKTKRHRQFADKDENYKGLDEIIARLPSIYSLVPPPVHSRVEPDKTR